MKEIHIYIHFLHKIGLRHTFLHYQSKAISRSVYALCFSLLIFHTSGCDRVLGLKVEHAPVLTNEHFESAKGLSVPFELFLPNSITGWELSRFTKMHFDSSRNVYEINNIRLDLPQLDGQGPRFKICSNDWKYQFGFGKNLSDKESSFGVDADGVVLEIMIEENATADMRYEISQAASKQLEQNMMSVEFKLTSIAPTPRGYMRVKIY